MAEINLTDGLKKILLAGIGAVATTAEKSSQILDDLVAKGELTVEQGKALNQELKHTVENARKKDTEDAAAAEEEKEDKEVDVDSLLSSLTPEQREELKKKLAEQDN